MGNERRTIVLILFAMHAATFGPTSRSAASTSDEIEQAYAEGRGVDECASAHGFVCRSGDQCIERIKLCDGREDCADSSDETADCRQTKCPDFAYRCNYGACIDGAAKCNDARDCADNSDEWPSVCSNRASPATAARKTVACPSDAFRCDSGECVNRYARCDGVVHCGDGSDETRNLCSDANCTKDSYRCRYGACVHKFAPCNEIKDCADNSDEDDAACRPATPRQREHACVVPDPPANGRLYVGRANGMRFTGGPVEEGATVSYACNRNYVLSPDVVHHVCSTVGWDPPTVPTCVRRRKGSRRPHFIFSN